MRKKRILWIPAAVSAAIAVSISEKAERTRRKQEEQATLPPGKMVDTEYGRMHVRIVGDGAKTVVMLPGHGTAGPSVDFYPLAEMLAQKGIRCVIPDPFGYGFSDDTKRERTAQNIIEEIRTAFRKIGIDGPYYLLGHSISGLYIRIWADLYPAEIRGLIAEDISLPEQFGALGILENVMDVTYVCAPLMRILDKIGIGRIFTTSGDTIKKAAQGDTNREQVLKYLAVRNNFSNAVCDEFRHMKNNAQEAAKTGPCKVPVLVFIATGKGSGATVQFKNGFSWVDAHYKFAQDAIRGTTVELQGMHYLHWSYAKEMAEEMGRFITADN